MGAFLLKILSGYRQSVSLKQWGTTLVDIMRFKGRMNNISVYKQRIRVVIKIVRKFPYDVLCYLSYNEV